MELLIYYNGFAHMPHDILEQARNLLEQQAQALNTNSQAQTGDLVRLHTFQGAIDLSLEKPNEASEHFQRALHELKKGEDVRSRQDGVGALLHYIIARLHCQQKQWEAASKSLQASMAYTKYQMHRLMAFRLHSMKQTIAKGKLTTGTSA